jgi:hypothetical protein
MGVARSLGKRLETTPRKVKRTTRPKGRRGMTKAQRKVERRKKRAIWRAKRNRHTQRLELDWF